MPPHWASSEEAVIQPAPVSLPSEPINGVTCGIDWARDDHAVSVVDRFGREVQRWSVVHSEAGLRGLTQTRS